MDCDLPNYNVIFHEEFMKDESSDQNTKDNKGTAKTEKDDTENNTSSPNDNESEEGCINTFEYCSVLQDCESTTNIAIIREKVTEESRKHPNESESCDDSTARRYMYCSEVIKPYIGPGDCSVSKEKLARNALDSAKKDFDNLPCFGTFQEYQDQKENNSEYYEELTIKESCPNEPAIPCPTRGYGPSVEELKEMINTRNHEKTFCILKTAAVDVLCTIAQKTKEVASDPEAVNKAKQAVRDTGAFISKCDVYVRAKAREYMCTDEVCRKPPGRRC